MRLVHRLDSLLDGGLFGHHEVLVANEIARRQGLDIAFHPPLAVLRNQELKEINRTRRLELMLIEAGPKHAIGLVPSFHRLCQEVVNK